MEIKKQHFETIGSTNTWAKQNAAQFDRKALTVITAGEQTAGRGRFTRSWVSPKGCSVYATYVFFLNRLDEGLGNIPQILSFAAYEVLSTYLDAVKIKWPNDLVVQGKKLGGILCELTEVAPAWAVVTGIGINVNVSEEILNAIDQPATSLMAELGKKLSVEEIEAKITDKFNSHLTLFFQEGFKPFHGPFCRALAHQTGDTIKFHDFQTVITGKFEGINPDGSLNMKLTDGTIKRYVSGELVH